MGDFEYTATHRGEETEDFFSADYMVNCEGKVIGYKLKNDIWREASPQKFPGQVFPKVSSLTKVGK